MANIFDTAVYILKRKGNMSSQKLQILCYYAQAWSLAWNGQPLFPEDFVALKDSCLGPICPELYKKIHNGFMIILKKESNLNAFTDVQKNTIDSVIECYGSCNETWLCRASQNEYPWIKAVSKTNGRAGIITKDILAAYFSGIADATNAMGVHVQKAVDKPSDK